MDAVGIICEYNPLHNGHIHHIKETKRLFPGSPIILVLNGYFLQRGEVSLLSKENKTKLALTYGVDLVVELPFIFGTQSADIFAETAITILHHLGCKYFVFGSESNDIEALKRVAKIQDSKEYNERVKDYLKTGINYPTALAKALNIQEDIFNPNDLLGISYIKAIIKNHYDITPITIKRTSSYHNLEEENDIISASNIRHKLKNKESITKYIPRTVEKYLEDLQLNDLFPYLKYKILTDQNLSKYLTVDEGIENRLKEKVIDAQNIEDFIANIKTKRYTYNKISRMFIHILASVPKDINQTKLDYIKILGFNSKGRQYLHNLKEDLEISLIPFNSSLVYKYEMLAAEIYSLISKNKIIEYEKSNKPIYMA